RLDRRLLAGREHVVRLVLRGLHVGLVERVDLEIRAGDRDRELPPEELRAEVVRLADQRRGVLTGGAVRRPARRRDEALALLPGRLGDQLLGPEAEAARGLADADLVAALLPARAERRAELEAGVVGVGAARVRGPLGTREQPVDIDPHQR